MNLRRIIVRFFSVCAILMTSGCSCDNRVINRTKSPDGNYEAIAESEDCGATVLNFLVTLYRLPRNDSQWPLMSSPRGQVFYAGYAYHLQVAWLDNSHLQISCPGCSNIEVDHQERLWKGITRQYVSDRDNQSK